MSIFSPPVARHAEIDARLNRHAVAAVGVSGGKDSVVAALATARYLEEIGHRGTRLLIHADLGSIEWRDSLPACERLAEHLGWPLVVVRREKGDMVARWHERWAANVTRYQNLERLKLVLPWSTPDARFCTSELKTAPICQWLCNEFPGQEIVSITGIRRQESRDRANKPVANAEPKLERKRSGTTGWTWNPVIDWSLQDVWHEIHASGVTPHVGYTDFGMSRISCCFCIMSNIADLRASVSNDEHLDVFRELVDLELDSTFSFHSGRWLADIAPERLLDDQLLRLPGRKEAAERRQKAEALVPKYLSLTDGWPTALPTPEEAELLAGVRAEVFAAVGIDPRYVTAETVFGRYRELMDQKSAKDNGPRGSMRTARTESRLEAA